MINDLQINAWKHLIVDLSNVNFSKFKKLKSDEIIWLLEKFLINNHFTVLWNKFHFFSWIDSFTWIFLLAESHFSIHTWPEIWYVSIDLFCCNISGDYTKNMNNALKEIIASLFSWDIKISKKIISRWF